jgi:hypothetical protein
MVRKAEGSHESPPENRHNLVEAATARLDQGLSPPRELYLVQNRDRIPWSQFPGWARPSDPELFDGCCHEG